MFTAEGGEGGGGEDLLHRFDSAAVVPTIDRGDPPLRPLAIFLFSSPIKGPIANVPQPGARWVGCVRDVPMLP